MLWRRCECECHCDICGLCPYCVITPRFFSVTTPFGDFTDSYADMRSLSFYTQLTCRDGYPQYYPPTVVPCNTCDDDFGDRHLQASGTTDLIKYPNDDPPFGAVGPTVPALNSYPKPYPPWTSPSTGQVFGDLNRGGYCQWFAYTQCCYGLNGQAQIHTGGIGLRIFPLIENAGDNYIGGTSPYISIGGVCGMLGIDPGDMPCFTHLGFQVQYFNQFIPYLYGTDPSAVTVNYLGVIERERDCTGQGMGDEPIELDLITASDYHLGIAIDTVGGTPPGDVQVTPHVGPFSQARTGCFRRYYYIGSDQWQSDDICPPKIQLEPVSIFIP